MLVTFVVAAATTTARQGVLQELLGLQERQQGRHQLQEPAGTAARASAWMSAVLIAMITLLLLLLLLG
jgi:hypothetical protein